MRRLPRAIRLTLALALIAAWLLPGPVVADRCLGQERLDIQWTTPGSRFADNQDGTVTDSITGLVWMRCPLGQTWNGGACEGNAVALDWQEALREADTADFAGFTDWRLPNLRELASIVEQRCRLPAQNDDVFPASEDDVTWEQAEPPAGPEDDPLPVSEAWIFWTSSPYAGDIGNASYAWTVDFKNGLDLIKTRADPLTARLVRSPDPD